MATLIPTIIEGGFGLETGGLTVGGVISRQRQSGMVPSINHH